MKENNLEITSIMKHYGNLVIGTFVFIVSAYSLLVWEGYKIHELDESYDALSDKVIAQNEDIAILKVQASDANDSLDMIKKYFRIV